eukprot:gene38537-42511_t
MDAKAALKDGAGAEAEDVGLSVLDVVRHAAKTVAHTLQEQDTLSIKLDGLVTEGCTNIWAGLDLGLRTLGQPAAGRQAALLLLTDGQPNSGPRTDANLRKARAKGLRAATHSFGFGYSLDSALLRGVAQEAGGSYAFIPDCSLVGTVFVNSLSNILVTVAPRATKAGLGATLTLTVDGGTFAGGSAAHVMDVGPLQLGQAPAARNTLGFP